MIRSGVLRFSIIGRNKISPFSSMCCPVFAAATTGTNNVHANLSLNHRSNRFDLHISKDNRRWYTPFTKEEEEKERARVVHLNPEDKEQELRHLNREITKLEILRGINNGERYTWSGRYKELVRNYGLPLFVYYWTVWSAMGVGIYFCIDFGGLDVMSVLDKVDSYMNFSLKDKVDPELGRIGLALVMNECLEPLRLPFVVMTLKPVMDRISPTKY